MRKAIINQMLINSRKNFSAALRREEKRRGEERIERERERERAALKKCHLLCSPGQYTHAYARVPSRLTSFLLERASPASPRNPQPAGREKILHYLLR